MKVEIVKEFNEEKFKQKIESIINNVQRREKLIDIKYCAETKYIGNEVINVYHALLLLLD